MKYYEIKVAVMLNKDINYLSSSEMIGNNISRAMLQSDELKKFHKEKVYKYVFDNFYPLELEDGIYKKGKIYMFYIRSFNEDFINIISQCLKNFESKDLKVMAVEQNKIEKRHIDAIETVTPAVVTVNNEPWLQKDDMLLLIERLHANAEKKYKMFFNQEIGEMEEYFIEKLKILNRKPAYYNYKGMKILGNKFRIKVNDDEKSQKLAFIALGAGLAEKNSILGAGFCKNCRRS